MPHIDIPPKLRAQMHQALDQLLDRLCACERCGTLFFDASKNGVRRWCSTRTCGNREKVEAFRRRAAGLPQKTG